MFPEQQQSGIKPIYIILTLIFLTFYSIVSSYLQHHHLPIHKSAVAIITGIIAGFVVFIYSNTNYENITKFNDDIVFTILYPPMLFAAGFNLKKKAFLKNMNYISLFGILGTFAFFIIIVVLLYWANQLNIVRDAKDWNKVRALSIWEVLLLGACFCSIDTIASQQAISSRKFPKLFSIVFGEGIFKDAITIVLFRSILRLQELETASEFIFYWYTPLRILWNFVVLVVCSCIQGIVVAFAVTYLFKRARFLLNNQGITETCIVFLIGFCIYAISQAVYCSGVISVLVYGLALNHYGTYNMSQKGVQIAKSTFQFTSIICEGLLFLIMGVVVWQAQWTNKDKQGQNMTHSYIFALCVFLILVLGRTINVLLVIGIGKLFSKKFSITKEQAFILIVSGLVKGATPFALFSSVQIGGNSAYSKNQGMVLKTTVILIIIVTSILLNSLIPKIYKKSLTKLQSGVLESIRSSRQQSKRKKKNPGKIGQLQQKYLKKFLIFEYQQRKSQIQKIKQRNKNLSFIQTLKQLGAVDDTKDVSLITQNDQNVSLLSINEMEQTQNDSKE